MSQYTGEILALSTAFCWSITSLSFESAGKKVGSLSVNFIRLVMAFFFIGFLNISRGLSFFPSGLDSKAWIFLSISGIIGFALGDLFLFQAFVEIGARLSMLIMSLVPLVTTITGIFILDEMLGLYQWTGMFLTISGVSMVIMFRRKSMDKNLRKTSLLRGCLFAFGGVLGQSSGLILSKLGMRTFDAFTSTQIRIIAGTISFIIILSIAGRWTRVRHALVHRTAMVRISTGAFFGPFLGVSLGLLALQYTTAGVTATLNSVVPILIIPPAVIIFRERVNIPEIAGTVVAVAGIAFMFL